MPLPPHHHRKLKQHLASAKKPRKQLYTSEKQLHDEPKEGAGKVKKQSKEDQKVTYAEDNTEDFNNDENGVSEMKMETLRLATILCPSVIITRRKEIG